MCLFRKDDRIGQIDGGADVLAGLQGTVPAPGDLPPDAAGASEGDQGVAAPVEDLLHRQCQAPLPQPQFPGPKHEGASTIGQMDGTGQTAAVEQALGKANCRAEKVILMESLRIDGKLVYRPVETKKL